VPTPASMTTPTSVHPSTTVVASIIAPTPTPLVVHIPSAVKPIVVKPNKPATDSSQLNKEGPESELSSDEQSDDDDNNNNNAKVARTKRFAED
jgi:hypothetical protein